MANKKIICNDTAHETRVALVEDGNITELFIERAGASDSTGNIYKGRVQRVLPGMQAAFVDIGLSQAAFLYVNDILTDNHSENEVFCEPDSLNSDESVEKIAEKSIASQRQNKSEISIIDLIT